MSFFCSCVFLHYYDIDEKDRRLNVSPVFTNPLQSLNITPCKTTSYLLPSVFDSDGDNYSITASLFDGTELPNWIYFDSRKFVILMPKSANTGSNYDLKIRLTDSSGLYTEYRLAVSINSATIQLNSFKNIELVSPQKLVYTYDQILTNSYNFDLNSSISLKDASGNMLPYWIDQSSSEYKCTIDTQFNPKESMDYNLYFQVVDYCGVKYNTNTFKLKVDPNKPPSINKMPSNVVFFKGQDSMTIPTPINMFLDPGDTFSIYTTLCLEKGSQALRTYYNETGNYIQVLYPDSFVSTCTIAIVAKDSFSNIALSLLQITVEQCAQTQCAVCIGNRIADCTECEQNHIMNMRTKECIPILSIYSLASIKIFGMFCFFFLLVHFVVQFVLKLIANKEISADYSLSIVSMMQTVLIVTHFDNNVSDIWRSFSDGFQYFKFEFRFLNIVLYVSSSINDKSESVPDRMYDLFFENKSAVICFCNLLIVIAIIALLKVTRHFVLKSRSIKRNQEIVKKKRCKCEIIKQININIKTLISMSFQFFILCLYSEMKYSRSFLTFIGVFIFIICMIVFKYIILYREARSIAKKEIIKAYILCIYDDLRKIALCVLFFIEQSCYILILTPIVLQTVSLLIFILCNNIKQRINKILCIVNECSSIIFCIFCVFIYSCLSIQNSFAFGSGFIMIVFFMIILSFEIAVLIAQDIKDFNEIIKTRKAQRITPNPNFKNMSKSIEKISNSQFKQKSSIKRNSCITNKRLRFNPDLNVINENKEASLQIENIEDSMHNICDISEIKRIKKGRRESKPKRLEDSKYKGDEIQMKDVVITPKIEIIEYSIDSSINKNKSILSAAAGQDGFDKFSNSNYTPVSARLK